MKQSDLTRQETHFSFGKNWSDYALNITDADIKEAERGLSRLLGGGRLDGKRFLDIGCGSGLHSVAALRLGAKEVVAVDIDPDSVATARKVLTHQGAKGSFRVEQASVFELHPSSVEAFDTVYSWGVLHHTGDMERAIAHATAMVRAGGDFIFALYRRIWLDPFWRAEKRWYAKASPELQARARALYVSLFRLGLRLKGSSFSNYITEYRSNRGMSYYHDVHDWMGGWPYESISSDEVERMMAGMGFARVRVFARSPRGGKRTAGLFGSGCDEYVYRRGGGRFLTVPGL